LTNEFFNTIGRIEAVDQPITGHSLATAAFWKSSWPVRAQNGLMNFS
jgi:hypothetical protein